MLLKSLPSCFSKDKAERLQAKRDCQLAAWLSMTGISQARVVLVDSGKIPKTNIFGDI